MEIIIRSELNDHIKVMNQLDGAQQRKISAAAQKIIDAYKSGGKVLLFGNGGSAADAQHIACELAGRFLIDRKPLPAIALTTNSSNLTAIGNDYGFDDVFTRQVKALTNVGDIVIALSTSGRSKNVLDAVKASREKGAFVIGMTGRSAKGLAELSDLTIAVPSDNTPRIQEAHITIGHILCLLVEKSLFEGQIV